MKIAISVPDSVFEEAERVSKTMRVPRSRLYCRAMEEFLTRQRGKSIREALDEVYGSESSELDPVLVELQAQALREEW